MILNHCDFPISSPTEIKASGFGKMNCHLWQAPKKYKRTRFPRKLGRRSPWNEHFDFVSRSLRKKKIGKLAWNQLFPRMWAAVEVHETFGWCIFQFFSCWVDPNRAKLSHRFARSSQPKVKKVVKIIKFWWPKIEKWWSFCSFWIFPKVYKLLYLAWIFGNLSESFSNFFHFFNLQGLGRFSSGQIHVFSCFEWL